MLTSVLDAGELADDQHRLLAFTAGFLFMKSKGVPIADTVKMAKTHQRRIRLDWSAKRWKHEHDLLSRADALKRLAADNTHYDVSDIRSKLPEQFGGYLITSSRRLGMEGLRQRHCVSAYHDGLQNGRSAMACIFVDKKRWTVELCLVDKDSVIKIMQIKSRYNETPTTDVEKRIHDLLDIPLQTMSSRLQNARFGDRSYVPNLQRALPILREHGVERVIVYFDGSGDEGHVDYVSYHAQNRTIAEIAINSAMVTVESCFNTFDEKKGGWSVSINEKQCRMDVALTEITEDYLGITDVDWYNDDGGFGEFIIDVVNGTAKLEVNSRFSESTLEFDRVINIDTGEEVNLL